MIQHLTRNGAGWLCLALLCAALPSATSGQGTIVFVTPSQSISYGPVGDGAQHNLDLNADGVTDYVLSFDIGGARFSPLGSNGVIVDGGYDVAALNRGEVIASSLDPAYQWVNANTAPGGYAVLGGQAVFEGMYFYSGNFSGLDAFIGLRFQYGGQTHYGWMEIYNYPNVAAGQVLGWAYETRSDTPIFAGTVPEPSTIALLGVSSIMFWVFAKRSGKVY